MIEFKQAFVKMLLDSRSSPSWSERINPQPQDVAVWRQNGAQLANDFKRLADRIRFVLQLIVNDDPGEGGAAGDAGDTMDQQRFTVNFACECESLLDVLQSCCELSIFRAILLHVVEVQVFRAFGSAKTQWRLHPAANRQDVPTRQFGLAQAKGFLDTDNLHFQFI